MAKVGKYELVRKLATGGMAEVFLAKAEWARGVERTVVVKRILSHLAEDPNFVDMFLSEAKLAAQLSHPNIVQIFEFGETEGVYYLAMEYVDGPNLRTLGTRAHEQGTPIDYRLCAKLIAESCEALAYAHELVDPVSGVPLQLVHRDISPDNIILSRSGAVKVVDFGIAKAVTQSHHTKTGLIKGKLAYMAPEQLKTKGIDKRADVYALGVVLYELVAGAKPYDAESEVTMMHAVLYEPMVPIRQRRPETPAELETIVNRALAHDREERYPDCRAFHNDLERFIMSSGRDPVGTFEISKLISDLQAKPTGGSASQVMGMATPSRQMGAVTPAGAERREATPPQPAGVAEVVALKATGTEGGGPAPILLTGNLIASALLGTPEGGAAPQAPQARAHQEPRPAPKQQTSDRTETEEMPALQAEPPTMPSAPKPTPKREAKPAAPAAKGKQPKARASEPEAPKPRSKVPLIAAGAGLVVVLAAVGVVLLPKDSAQPPEPTPKQPDPVAVVTPPPTPDPVPDPVTQPTPDPTPEPGKDPEPATPDPQPEPEGILLVVKSDPPARIKVLSGKRTRASGKSPLSTRLPAGAYDVEVFDDAQGLFKRGRVVLKAGAETERETITLEKGTFLISSFPWANVSVSGKALGATPQRAQFYEGRHTIKFECSNGKKDEQKVELAAGAEVRVKGKCE